ncbi:MAG: ATP-binding protein, partial [Candidatus Limnocylindria bacterium]
MGTPVGSGTATRTALTSFVGRRHELARLRALLSASRLVTITGPGGAGKTRLAEEFVVGLARSIGDGVAVAYLATATGPIDVTEVTSAAVGLRNMGSRGVGAELIDYLRERRLVLVLDNCEHVGAAAAELAAELLRACPGIVIVATGRQPLHVPGEQLFPIGGLDPDVAVELFVDRARLAAPDFTLDAASGSLVDELCGHLDGMPLAIELAASQVSTRGLGELIRGLRGRVPELASRSTVAPERQRTLRQAIGWSHDLLSDAQRVLWRRLSVFSDGFTLEAAQQVAGVAPIDPSAVPGLVGDLVDQSMVVFQPAADRYRLLEVLREFARERLREADEESLIAERHRRWIVGLADGCDDQWFGPDQAGLIDRMHVEVGNLRAALDGCRETDAAAGLRLASDAFWYWLTRASLEEGLRWCQAFLGRSGDPALEARASWRAAYLALMRREFDAARGLVRQAYEEAAAADDALARSYSRIVAGAIVTFEHPGEAEDGRRLSAASLEDPAADTMSRAWAL